MITKQSAFKLSDEDRAYLKALGIKYGLNNTSTVKLIIRLAAEREGISLEYLYSHPENWEKKTEFEISTRIKNTPGL